MSKGTNNRIVTTPLAVSALLVGLVSLPTQTATAAPSVTSAASTSAPALSFVARARALGGLLPASPMQLAQAVDEPVLDADLSDARSVSYANPDGTHTTNVSQVPINYQNSAGDWVAIDSDLASTLRAGYAAENVSNDFNLLIPRDIGSTPVRLEDDGGAWLSFKLLDADGAPVLTDDAAKVADGPGPTKVRFDSVSWGVKETITLNAPPAAAPSYVSELTLSPGLTPQLTDTNEIVVRDAVGDLRFRVRAPFMEDSSGTPEGFSTAVAYSLVESGEGWRLTMTPDFAWLSDPARVYPVRVDPTTTPVTPSMDTFLDQGSPSSSGQTGTWLRAGGDASGNRTRSLVKFQLPSGVPISSTVTVSAANLIMNVTSARVTSPSTPISVEVRRMNVGWALGATWNNSVTPSSAWSGAGSAYHPTLGSQASIGGNAVGTLKNFDVTNIVDSWVKGTAVNNGFMVKAVSEPAANEIRFTSAEGATNKPSLSFTWASQPPSVVAGSATIADSLPSGTSVIARSLLPSVSGTVKDNDSSQIVYAYQVVRVNADTTETLVWSTAGTVNNPSPGSPVAAPAATVTTNLTPNLSAGVNYRLKVWAGDETTGAAGPVTLPFTVDQAPTVGTPSVTPSTLVSGVSETSVYDPQLSASMGDPSGAGTLNWRIEVRPQGSQDPAAFIREGTGAIGGTATTTVPSTGPDALDPNAVYEFRVGVADSAGMAQATPAYTWSATGGQPWTPFKIVPPYYTPTPPADNGQEVSAEGVPQTAVPADPAEAVEDLSASAVSLPVAGVTSATMSGSYSATSVANPVGLRGSTTPDPGGQSLSGAAAMGDIVQVSIAPVAAAESDAEIGTPGADAFGTPSLSIDMLTADEGAAPGSGESIDPNTGVASCAGPCAEDLDTVVSYGQFASSYGGHWSDRLEVTAYPDCYGRAGLTEAETEICSTGVLVPSVNDDATNKLFFTAGPAKKELPSGATEVPPVPAEGAIDSCFSTPPDSEEVADPDHDMWTAPGTPAEVDAADTVTDDSGSGAFDDGSSANDGADDADDAAPSDPAPDPVEDVELEVTVSSAPACKGLKYLVHAGVGAYSAAGGGAESGSGSSATALNPSSSWQVGEGSGEFSWSYPFAMPTGVSDEAPSLALSYSSGSIDGMSGPEAGQASQVGLGWSLEPGSITRTYASCAKDGDKTKGDLCWRTTAGGDLVNDLTIVLNGHSSKLIQDAVSKEWRLQDDPGWRVEYYHDPAAPNAPQAFVPPTQAETPDNADNNDEAFRITSPDGTRYWFGLNDGTTTNSVWTVPVVGNDNNGPGTADDEPCYAGSFGASFCDQAWQWNLDKVIDPDGNVVRYEYKTETNRYQRNASLKDDKRTSYTMAGRLSRILYGYVGGTGVEDYEVEVMVSSGERCNPKLLNALSSCDGPRKAPRKWPDVPTDLICGSNGNCKNFSPSFFSLYRYTGVTTKRGNTVLDQYLLHHKMPDPDNATGGDEPDLWLDQIEHVDPDGPTPGMPFVNFNGKALPNRVKPGNALPLMKYRVDGVRNEMGGRVKVEYGHADGKACTPGYVDDIARWQSERECFAIKYARPGSGQEPRWIWFHKYMVKKVTLTDDVLGLSGLDTWEDSSKTSLATNRVYTYEYDGKPGWRFDSNSINSKIDERSWNDWRGYRTVYVKTMRLKANNPVEVNGADPVWSKRKIVHYRGMSRSRSDMSGCFRHDFVPTVENGAEPASPVVCNGSWPTLAGLEDLGFLQGRTAEESVLQPSGNWLTRTYRGYRAWPTAKDVFGRTAWFVGENLTRGHQFATGIHGSTFDQRHTVTRTFHDGGSDHRGVQLGLVTATVDQGASTTSNPNQDPDVCTSTEYAANSAAWIRVPTKTEVSTGCDTTTATDDKLLSRVQTAYDGSTVFPEGGHKTGATIALGHPTQITTWTDATDANKNIVTYATYDTYGRVKKTRDGRGTDTETDYNNNNALPTLVTTTTHLESGVDARSLETLDARGLPTELKDDNNQTTAKMGYDGYGRLSYIQSPKVSGSGVKSVKYDYNVRATAGEGPSSVVTSTRLHDDMWASSYTYYDGWGRTLETQTPRWNSTLQSPKRAVAATAYNELGLPATVMSSVINGAAPGSGLLNPKPDNTRRSTRTTYDVMGRPTVTQNYNQGTARPGDLTQITYQPQHTITLPPVGGVTLTSLDGWGRPTTVAQYDRRDIADDDKVRKHYADYTYDGLGQLTDITSTIDTDLEHWTYSYDLAGRRTGSTDPDTGTLTNTYDANGNLVETDNHVDPAIHTVYDLRNRPKHRTAGSDPAHLVDWNYDSTTNGFGRLTSVTSHTHLGDYTRTVNGYDANGNPTGVTYTYPQNLFTTPATGTTSLTEGYSYDAADTVTQISYGQVGDLKATTVDYAYYDTTGQPSTVSSTSPATAAGGTNSPGSADAVLLAKYTYDKYGQTTGLTTRGADINKQMVRTYAWDDNTGRLATTGGTGYGSLTYTYDLGGNPRRIDLATIVPGSSPPVGRAAAWCYTYDALNRLETVKTGTGATCSVSPAGTGTKPTELDLVGAQQSLEYKYVDDRLTQVNSLAPNGTIQTTAEYRYNEPVVTTGTGAVPTTRPHLTGQIDVTDPGSPAISPAMPTATDLTYDALGRLTAADSATATHVYNPTGTLKWIHKSGGDQLDYAYDDTGIRTARRQGNGTKTTVLYLGATEVTVTHDAAGAITDVTGRRIYSTAAGTPLATQQGEGTPQTPTAPTWTFLFADSQGSTRSAIDQSAGTPSAPVVASWAAYTPFGQLLTAPQDTGPARRAYLHKTLDPNGDLRLDHRNYSPMLNVLTTPDPVLVPGNPQTLNPYSYAGNNPIASSDPSGLMMDSGDDNLAYDPPGIALCQNADACNKDAPTLGEAVGNVIESVGNDATDVAQGTKRYVGGLTMGLGAMGSPLRPDLKAQVEDYATSEMLDGGAQATSGALGLAATASWVVPPMRGAGVGLRFAVREYGVRAAEKRLAAEVAGNTGKALELSPASPNFPWPPGVNGFLGSTRVQVLKPGTQIDRYGLPTGRFASPSGTPLGMRSLRPGSSTELTTYEVIRRLPAETGVVTPWFGEIGLGIQYRLPATVSDLIEAGYLRKVG